MIHSNCKGKIILDCSSQYLIQSPSVKITTDGIEPGIVQIGSKKSKNGLVLACQECGETFVNKAEFDSGIVEYCSICERYYPPSQIYVMKGYNNIRICEHCKSDNNTRVSQLYGEVIRKATFKSLLEILTIKK